MRFTQLASAAPSVGALVAFVGASFALPAVASAQTTMRVSPALIAPMAQLKDGDRGEALAFTGHGVGIVSCSVDHYANVAPTTDGTPPDTAPLASGIHVAFVDTADTAVDSVTVLVTYAGERRQIVDRGHFSPGVTIDHRFTAFAGEPLVAEDPDSCTVASVHFEGSPGLL